MKKRNGITLMVLLSAILLSCSNKPSDIIEDITVPDSALSAALSTGEETVKGESLIFHYRKHPGACEDCFDMVLKMLSELAAEHRSIKNRIYIIINDEMYKSVIKNKDIKRFYPKIIDRIFRMEENEELLSNEQSFDKILFFLTKERKIREVFFPASTLPDPCRTYLDNVIVRAKMIKPIEVE